MVDQGKGQRSAASPPVPAPAASAPRADPCGKRGMSPKPEPTILKSAGSGPRVLWMQSQDSPAPQASDALAADLRAGWPISVRRLLVDLDQPVTLHWNGGLAFSSQMFNALSMSFPAGEQFFIDALRAGVKSLPEDRRQAWATDLALFVGQEATHRHLHAKFNALLEGHGLDNAWARRVQFRLRRRQGRSVQDNVAATAAYEHLTAVLAQALLLRPQWLQGAPQPLRLLWEWHSAEELEHRCVAHALLLELGVGRSRRVFWALQVMLEFHVDLARQTLDNLRRSGTLWRLATWREAARWLLGRDGVLRAVAVPMLAALRPDYDPARLSVAPAQVWLRSHADRYSELKRLKG